MSQLKLIFGLILLVAINGSRSNPVDHKHHKKQHLTETVQTPDSIIQGNINEETGFSDQLANQREINKHVDNSDLEYTDDYDDYEDQNPNKKITVRKLSENELGAYIEKYLNNYYETHIAPNQINKYESVSVSKNQEEKLKSYYPESTKFSYNDKYSDSSELMLGDSPNVGNGGGQLAGIQSTDLVYDTNGNNKGLIGSQMSLVNTNGGQFKIILKVNDTNSDIYLNGSNTTLSSLINNTIHNYEPKGNLSESERRQRQRELTRDAWLTVLKTRVLTSVGRQDAVQVTQPNSANTEEIVKHLNLQNLLTLPNTEGPEYTEKIQSFHPKCEIPRNTDEEVWSDPNNMNLLFNLNLSNAIEGHTIYIAKATLRLYKIFQNVSSLSEVPRDGDASQQGNVNLISDEDKQIRVSVYWYTRSLKKHRVKRRLADSKMLPMYDLLPPQPSIFGQWIEFNIRAAAKSWIKTGRNLGLGIVIEDQEGTVLPTEKHFRNIDCSNSTQTSTTGTTTTDNKASSVASIKPLPGPIIDAATKHYSANSTIHLNSLLLIPYVELCTIDIPTTELHRISEISSTACRFNIDHNNLILFNSNYQRVNFEMQSDQNIKSDGEQVSISENMNKQSSPMGSENGDKQLLEANNQEQVTEYVSHNIRHHNHYFQHDPRNSMINRRLIVSRKDLESFLQNSQNNETTTNR